LQEKFSGPECRAIEQQVMQTKASREKARKNGVGSANQVKS
jgi:hypothetical protein